MDGTKAQEVRDRARDLKEREEQESGISLQSKESDPASGCSESVTLEESRPLKISRTQPAIQRHWPTSLAPVTLGQECLEDATTPYYETQVTHVNLPGPSGTFQAESPGIVAVSPRPPRKSKLAATQVTHVTALNLPSGSFQGEPGIAADSPRPARKSKLAAGDHMYALNLQDRMIGYHVEKTGTFNQDGPVEPRQAKPKKGRTSKLHLADLYGASGKQASVKASGASAASASATPKPPPVKVKNKTKGGGRRLESGGGKGGGGGGVSGGRETLNKNNRDEESSSIEDKAGCSGLAISNDLKNAEGIGIGGKSGPAAGEGATGADGAGNESDASKTINAEPKTIKAAKYKGSGGVTSEWAQKIFKDQLPHLRSISPLLHLIFV